MTRSSRCGPPPDRKRPAPVTSPHGDSPGPSRLQAIQQRCAAATKGPWQALDDPDGIYGPHRCVMRFEYVVQTPDAVFTAASRTDLPWLLGLVTEARQLLEIQQRREGLEGYARDATIDAWLRRAGEDLA